MTRVGSCVFTTDQGLGYLARDFYQHGVVTDVAIISHGRRLEHDDWYPGSLKVGSLRDPKQIAQLEAFCESMDAMLFFETPFEWHLIDFCREIGVKTILMPMHECMPSKLPAIPDVMACPSDLDLKLYGYRQARGDLGNRCEVVRVNVPVPDWVKWRQRTRADVFVHNAGNGGLKGRNGCQELVDALVLVESNAKIVLRTQERSTVPWLEHLSVPRIPTEIKYGGVPQEELYDEGDVFIFPEKFNGLSLPLQEAFASGMGVMATDRFPNNTYLPQEMLIPIRGTVPERIADRFEQYDRAVIDPKDIALCIDRWHGKDISYLSEAGRLYGEQMSWSVQRPLWQEMIERVVVAR